jgi:hypothetical protein
VKDSRSGTGFVGKFPTCIGNGSHTNKLHIVPISSWTKCIKSSHSKVVSAISFMHILQYPSHLSPHCGHVRSSFPGGQHEKGQVQFLSLFYFILPLFFVSNTLN